MVSNLGFTYPIPIIIFISDLLLPSQCNRDVAVSRDGSDSMSVKRYSKSPFDSGFESGLRDILDEILGGGNYDPVLEEAMVSSTRLRFIRVFSSTRRRFIRVFNVYFSTVLSTLHHQLV